MHQLYKNNVLCSQSRAYADHMIAHIALHSAALLDRTIILVGNDTDLLVMLIDKVTPNTKLHMQFSSNPDVIFSIDQIQQSISVVLKSHLLILHAFTGCDNVSAIYNIGKRKCSMRYPVMICNVLMYSKKPAMKMLPKLVNS